jgi:hypothetical protein
MKTRTLVFCLAAIVVLALLIVGVNFATLRGRSSPRDDVAPHTHFDEEKEKDIDDNVCFQLSLSSEEATSSTSRIDVQDNRCSSIDSALDGSCDRVWRHRLLYGNVTKVYDPPECCRPWHAFDMFTLEFDGGAYRGVLKMRKYAEMTSDVVAYHAERVLQLNMTLPMFVVPIERRDYERLLGALRERTEMGDGERRNQRWLEMMQMYRWAGSVMAELQPFYSRKFTRVDGSVCAKMPDEERHPKVVFGCRDGRHDPTRRGSEHRSDHEKQLTCRVPRADIADTLLFDYITNMVDRKGNCFVRDDDARLLLLDNDSGSFDPDVKYPEGSGCCYPNLKRVRLRDIIEQEQPAPVHCQFNRATVERLRALHANAERIGGFGELVRRSLLTDTYFPFIATTNFHRRKQPNQLASSLPASPFVEINNRVHRLLNFYDQCQLL